MKTKVFFEFKTEEQWFDFLKKFSEHKEFVQVYSSQLKHLLEQNDMSEETVNFVELGKKLIHILIFVPFLELNSKESVQCLLNFIKENHYENNYQLRDDCDKLRMTISELLEIISD